MAIRIKNLDLNTDGMKGVVQVCLGDVTATRRFHVFTAPVACVVNSVDIYSNEANPPAGTTASTTNFSCTLQRGDTSAIMQVRGSSATAITSNSLLANTRYRLIPSANNSLSVGTPMNLVFTIGGSGTLSGTLVHVTYTPQKHRESR